MEEYVYKNASTYDLSVLEPHDTIDDLESVSATDDGGLKKVEDKEDQEDAVKDAFLNYQDEPSQTSSSDYNAFDYINGDFAKVTSSESTTTAATKAPRPMTRFKAVPAVATAAAAQKPRFLSVPAVPSSSGVPPTARTSSSPTTRPTSPAPPLVSRYIFHFIHFSSR